MMVGVDPSGGTPVGGESDDTPVDLEGFGLFDHMVQQDPHKYYGEMQRSAPLYEARAGGGRVGLVTRHADVLNLVRDPETFSSQMDTHAGAGGSELARRMRELIDEEGGYLPVRTMLTADPPEHTRFRRLVSKAFTPRVVNGFEPMIRQRAAALADRLTPQDSPGGEPVEFVSRFAVPFPVMVIAHALGVDDERLDDFKAWSDASIAGIGTNIGIEERLAAQRLVIDFQKYFAAQIEARRDHSTDDLLGSLVQARIGSDETDDQGRPIDDTPLTMGEMLSIVQQLLVAGNETTTKLLTEAMRLLAEHPDQWQALRNDPGRAPQVIEEVLRLATPTQGMYRVVTTDTEIGGCPVAGGSVAVAMFAAANRDPQVFADPHRFDPDRDGLANHLAFGKGIHFCLGAPLARLEARVALEELVARFSMIEIVDPADLEYEPSFLLRGLRRLELRLSS